MSKKSIFHRNYRHLILPGITLGVDVSKKGGRIAVATARLEDGYCRDTGRYIINTLFDENDQTLRAAQFTRNVFSIPYVRGFSASEVIQPLLDFIKDTLNERAIYRVLRQLFTYDATTKEKARKAAEKWKNPRIVSLYKNVVEELHGDDIAVFGKLRTLKQFDDYFFEWRGSASAVINGVQTFAQLMYQEMELESEMKGIAHLIDKAKKKEVVTDTDEAQLKEWKTELEKLSRALVKTKKVTGASLRKKVPVEKTAKPVKVLPRASSAPSGRLTGVAPCFDILEKISPPKEITPVPETPPPLPEEKQPSDGHHHRFDRDKGEWVLRDNTPPKRPTEIAHKWKTTLPDDDSLPPLDKIEEEEETERWRQPLTSEEESDSIRPPLEEVMLRIPPVIPED